MKTSVVLQIFIALLYALASEGIPAPNDKIQLTNMSLQTPSTSEAQEIEHPVSKSIRNLGQTSHGTKAGDSTKYLRGKSKQLLEKTRSNDEVIEITDSNAPERELTNANDVFGIFRKPIGQWEIEDWIVLLLLLFVLSMVLRCMRRIRCCGCDLLDCIGCYFCYEIFFDPSPGLNYGGLC